MAKITNIKDQIKDQKKPAPVAPVTEKLQGDVITVDRINAMSKAFESIDKTVDTARFQIMQIIAYSETHEIYKDADYKNNADFVRDYFGYEKATTSRFKSIMSDDLLTEQIPEKSILPSFGEEFDKLIKKDRKGLRRVKKEYQAYSTSKLYLLSQMAIVTVKSCKPSMSFRELEEVLKAEQNKTKGIEEKKKKEETTKKTAEQAQKTAEQDENTDFAKDMNSPKTYRLWNLLTISSKDPSSVDLFKQYINSESFKALIQSIKEGEEIAIVKLSETKDK